MVRVHLIQVLIIDVRIGKVKPVKRQISASLRVNLTDAISLYWPTCEHLKSQLTPAPGLRCWAGDPGMYGSDTADLYPSLRFFEPTPQPGCAEIHKYTGFNLNALPRHWNNINLVLFLQCGPTAASIIIQHSDHVPANLIPSAMETNAPVCLRHLALNPTYRLRDNVMVRYWFCFQERSNVPHNTICSATTHKIKPPYWTASRLRRPASGLWWCRCP